MKKSTQADIVFLSIVTLWGTSFALAKGALEYVSPVFFVLLRFTLAGAIWLVFYKKNIKKLKPGTWPRGMALGAVIGAGFILQTAGLDMTHAGMAGFLTGLAVVIVPLLVIVIERKIPKAASIAGVVICTVGLYILTSPAGAGFNTGDLMVIGAALCMALYIVFVEMFTTEYDTGALTLIQLVGLLAVVVPSTFFLETPSVEWNWPFIWRWLALGTMAGVTIALQIYWQRFISATRAAVIITLQTPLAAVFAFLFLGEMLTGAAYIGGGLIFLGMLVAEGGAYLRNDRRKPPATNGSRQYP